VDTPLHQVEAPSGSSAAGASAQAEFNRRVARHRAAMRTALPTVVAVTIIGMAAAAFAFDSYGRLIAALGAAAVGLVGASFIGRLPTEAVRWRSHAAAERRTAATLAPLESAGYVVLHDRTVPGVLPNIDHIAIGPGGVFVIETRHQQGPLAIAGEKLLAGEGTKSGLAEATYREAVAVQIALSDALGPARLTVQPIVCFHDTPHLLLEDEVHGLRVVAGAELVSFMRRQPVLLGADAIQAIAATTDRRLRPAA
jgi:nuclease-like protein